MRGAWLGVLTFVVLSSCTARAAAQSDSIAVARAHFEAAIAHYEEGDWENALHRFEASYAASPIPDLLHNMYLCLERLGRFDEAVDRLERYLEAVPDAEDRETLERHLVHLRRRAGAQRAPVEEPPPPAIVPQVSTPRAPEPGALALLGAGAVVAVGGVVILAFAASDETAVRSAEPGSAWRDVEDAYARTEPLSIAGGVSLAIGVAMAASGAAWLAVVRVEGAPEVAFGPGVVVVRGAL